LPVSCGFSEALREDVGGRARFGAPIAGFGTGETEMAEEEASFKVTDRRGHHREEGGSDARPAEPPPKSPPESQRPPLAEAPPDAESGSMERDLCGLFAMLASSALIALGEATDPDTGQVRVDLEQAREAIDVLLLLRDKTNGNRTEQESQFLGQVLYDVQMRFVRVSEDTRPH
jgi:hypothetical protein